MVTNFWYFVYVILEGVLKTVINFVKKSTALPIFFGATNHSLIFLIYVQAFTSHFQKPLPPVTINLPFS